MRAKNAKKFLLIGDNIGICKSYLHFLNNQSFHCFTPFSYRLVNFCFGDFSYRKGCAKHHNYRNDFDVSHHKTHDQNKKKWGKNKKGKNRNTRSNFSSIDEIYWCLRDCLLLKHSVNVALGSDGQVMHAVLNNAFFLK